MSTKPTADKPDREVYDPVFLNSRREAIIIFFVWMAALVWAVPYCYYYGFLPAGEEFDPHKMTTVLGIPTWLFFGIAVPWLAADAFTTWFCFWYMKDDDLGEPHEGADIAEEIHDMEERAARKEMGQ